MQSVCDILKAGNIPFEAHSLRGFAPERIVAHAGETKAEAIVMGTHGRGTFFDAVIGSVAGRVLAMAPCPYC